MADDIDAAARDHSWKKITIAKTNNEWQTAASIKVEREVEVETQFDPIGDTESCGSAESAQRRERRESGGPVNETEDQRTRRLAKMSAYAARRLANEKPEEREARLARMSAYAARRLAQETPEQRAKRLARMSAYAAKRLSQETPEQRASRLARMSAYAAKRHRMKKFLQSDNHFITLHSLQNSNENSQTGENGS